MQPPAGTPAPARRGVSSQVAGDAHGGSLTSAAPGPKRGRAACGGREVLVSRSPGATRQRQPECAGGWAWPVGNASDEANAPARALSSQSEQPPADVTTQRTLPSARAPAAATPAENACVAVVAGQPLHPLAAPFAEGRADAVAPGSLVPSAIAPAQHGHHGTGQPGRGLLHRRRPSECPPRSAPAKVVPAANASPRWLLRRVGEERQVVVLGPEQRRRRRCWACCAAGRAGGSGRRRACA